MTTLRPETLWCSNDRNARSNGWAFPRTIERVLQRETEGRAVLQLFGGRARWGVTLDIDRTCRPSVIGDAWMPPFRMNSFDVVILDPPYSGINQQMKDALLRAACYVAREHIYWFHTLWIERAPGLRRERSWLVRVGDSCACRCLIEWRVIVGQKAPPRLTFTRGPALKYRRWLAGEQRFPELDELRQ